MNHHQLLIEKILRRASPLQTREQRSSKDDSTQFHLENFSSSHQAREKIAALVAFLEQAKDADWTHIYQVVPVRKLHSLQEALIRTHAVVRTVVTSLTLDEEVMTEIIGAGKYGELAHQIETEHILIFEILGHFLGKSVFNQTEAKLLENRKKELMDLIESQTKELDHKKKAAEVLLATADSLKHYDEIIREHRRFMLYWLLMLIGGSVVSICALAYLFRLAEPEWPLLTSVEQIQGFSARIDTASMVLKGLGKFVLASFAIGFCVICSRNYQSHVHNYIVNQHRKAAAITFLLMFKNIESNDHKADLIRNAMETIFASTSTGFLSKGSNEFISLNPFVGELVKKL